MKVSRKNLLDLLVWDGQARLVVPGGHRPYEWSEKELLPLWSEWCIDCPRDVNRFCGTIILRHIPNPAVSTWEVIDGQQRLATFFVAFMALRDICRDDDIDFSELDGAFSLEGSDECRLVLLEGAEGDRRVMNALLRRTMDQLPPEMREASRLYQAYRFFRGKAREIPRNDVPGMIVKILQNVDVIVATAQEWEARHLKEVIRVQRKKAGRRRSEENSAEGRESSASRPLMEPPLDFISGFSQPDELAVLVGSLGHLDPPMDSQHLVDELKSRLESAQKQTRVREWLRHFRHAVRVDPILEMGRDGLDQPRGIPDAAPDSFVAVLAETLRENPAARPSIRNLAAAIVRLSVTLERPRYRAPATGAPLGGHANGHNGPQAEGETAFHDAVELVEEIVLAERALHGCQPRSELLGRYLERLRSRIAKSAAARRDLRSSTSAEPARSPPPGFAQQAAWTDFLRIDDPSRLRVQYGVLTQAVVSLILVLEQPAIADEETSPVPIAGPPEKRQRQRPPPLPPAIEGAKVLKETQKWEKPPSPAAVPAIEPAKSAPVHAKVVPPLPQPMESVKAPAAAMAAPISDPRPSLAVPVLPPLLLLAPSGPTPTPTPTLAPALSAMPVAPPAAVPAAIIPPLPRSETKVVSTKPETRKKSSAPIEPPKATKPIASEIPPDPKPSSRPARPTEGQRPAAWGWLPWLAALVAAIAIGRLNVHAGVFHRMAGYVGWFVLLIVTGLLLAIPFRARWRPLAACALIVCVSGIIFHFQKPPAIPAEPTLRISEAVRSVQPVVRAAPVADASSPDADPLDAQIRNLKAVAAAGHGDPRLTDEEVGVLEELSRLSKACHYAETQVLVAGVNPATITTQHDLEGRQWAVQQCQGPIQDLLTYLDHLDATLRADLAGKGVPARTIDQFLSDLHHSGQIDHLKAFWKLEAAIWADILARLDLLQANWGGWHMDKQTVIFDDDVAAGRDRAITQKIVEEDIEQRSLQNAPAH